MSTRANIIRDGFKPGTERKQFIDLLRMQGNRISYSERVVLDLHEENQELLAALKAVLCALDDKEGAEANEMALAAIARAEQKGA